MCVVWRGKKIFFKNPVKHAVFSSYGMYLSMYNCIYRVTHSVQPEKTVIAKTNKLAFSHVLVFSGIKNDQDKLVLGF